MGISKVNYFLSKQLETRMNDAFFLANKSLFHLDSLEYMNQCGAIKIHQMVLNSTILSFV